MDALTEDKTSGLRRLFDPQRPTQAAAEQAIRTLIRWMGDDPEREGLLDTPSRVLRACNEWFAGYREDPAEYLMRTFEEAGGYDEPVLLRGVPFRSCCEHHVAPITGVIHVSYLPSRKIVGLSKLVRVIDCFSRRLQIQERMTVQIADLINEVLQPKGVAVVVEAVHACMSTRGVHKHDVATVTSRMIGAFRSDPAVRAEFLGAIKR